MSLDFFFLAAMFILSHHFHASLAPNHTKPRWFVHYWKKGYYKTVKVNKVVMKKNRGPEDLEEEEEEEEIIKSWSS